MCLIGLRSTGKLAENQLPRVGGEKRRHYTYTAADLRIIPLLRNAGSLQATTVTDGAATSGGEGGGLGQYSQQS
jgi:hypothetical protein